MIDFSKDQASRHWLVCQAILSVSGVLTDGQAVWGQIQPTIAPGQNLSLVACYVPLTVPTGSPVVGRVKISEIFCRLFDATAAYNNSGVTSTLTVVPTGSVLQQQGTALIAGSISTAVPSLTSVQKVPAGSILSTQWATPFTAQLTPTGGGAVPGTVTTTLAGGGVGATTIPIVIGTSVATSALPGTGTATITQQNSSAVTAQTLPVVNMTMPNLITTVPTDIDISPTRNASVETGTVSCSLTNLFFNMSNPVYLTGSTVVNQPNGMVVGAGLYVVDVQPDGTYPIRDVVNDFDALTYDYLDMAVDQYFPVQGVGNGFTSREIRLRLPEPIIIGPGQALVVTYGNNYNNFWSGMTVCPFVRCLIEELTA